MDVNEEAPKSVKVMQVGESLSGAKHESVKGVHVKEESSKSHQRPVPAPVVSKTISKQLQKQNDEIKGMFEDDAGIFGSC